MDKKIEIQSTWDEIENWINPLRDKYLGELRIILADSQKKFDLKKLIEPAYRDWSNFRPLNPEDENDWTDWLAHIFETAPTGYFVKKLLCKDNDRVMTRYEISAVERETELPKNEDGIFRTDILIYLKDEANHIHIEVKKYDTDFKKAYPTAQSVNAYLNNYKTEHFILIPEESRTECLKQFGEIKNKYQKIEINIITWNDVADSLRNTLFNEEINNLDNKYTEWNVWASSFLGCIEQKLLGFVYIPENKIEQEQKKYSIYSLMKNLAARGNKMTTIDDIFFQKGLSQYLESRNTIDEFEKRLQEKVFNPVTEILKNKGFTPKDKSGMKKWDKDTMNVSCLFKEVELSMPKGTIIGTNFGIGFYKNSTVEKYSFMIFVIFFGQEYFDKKRFDSISLYQDMFIDFYPGLQSKEYCLIKKFKLDNEAVDYENEFKILIDELLKISEIM